MATRNRIAIVPRASADFGIYGLVSAVGEGEGAPENAVVGEGGGNDVDGGAGPAGIWRDISSRSGVKRASPALLMPPPMTIRAGFKNMMQFFRPRASGRTYCFTNSGSRSLMLAGWP